MLTLARINEIAASLWDTGWFYGGWYLVANALWFVAITLLALVLPPGWVALLAFVVPIGVSVRFIARYIWWPTGPVAIAFNELVKKVAKADLARFVVALLAFEVGWGLFVAYWPVENSPGLLVPFMGAVIAAMLFAIASSGKKGVLRKLSATFALAAAVLLLLFVPEVQARIEEARENAATGSTGVTAAVTDPTVFCLNESTVLSVGPGQDATFHVDDVLSGIPGRQEFRTAMSDGTTFVELDGQIVFSHPTGGLVAVCVGEYANMGHLQGGANLLWERAVYPAA